MLLVTLRAMSCGPRGVYSRSLRAIAFSLRSISPSSSSSASSRSAPSSDEGTKRRQLARNASSCSGPTYDGTLGGGSPRSSRYVGSAGPAVAMPAGAKAASLPSTHSSRTFVSGCAPKRRSASRSSEKRSPRRSAIAHATTFGLAEAVRAKMPSLFILVITSSASCNSAAVGRC